MVEIFGEYLARGIQFELKPEPYFEGYALKVRMGAGSDVNPLLPLPADKMQTPEAAQEWLEHVRDTMLCRFGKRIDL